jgi:hypothetical protein
MSDLMILGAGAFVILAAVTAIGALLHRRERRSPPSVQVAPGPQKGCGWRMHLINLNALDKARPRYIGVRGRAIELSRRPPPVVGNETRTAGPEVQTPTEHPPKGPAEHPPEGVQTPAEHPGTVHNGPKPLKLNVPAEHPPEEPAVHPPAGAAEHPPAAAANENVVVLSSRKRESSPAVRRADRPPDSLPVAEWFAKAVQKREGASVSAAELWQAYETYCRIRGRAAVDQLAFGRAIKALGIEKQQRWKGGVVTYRGIELRTSRAHVPAGEC